MVFHETRKILQNMHAIDVQCDWLIRNECNESLPMMKVDKIETAARKLTI